jgi:hypothetical protein
LAAVSPQVSLRRPLEDAIYNSHYVDVLRNYGTNL